MRKTLTLDIERLSLGGEGVAHAEGMVVFVPNAAPKDLLEVELTETHKRYGRARIVRVLRPSPDRVIPPCPYHFETQSAQRRFCGGCSWQHLHYAAQLNAKRALVQETLERIGNLRGFHVNPVLGMDDPWRYRNKVQQPVAWTGQKLVSGFYAEGTH